MITLPKQNLGYRASWWAALLLLSASWSLCLVTRGTYDLALSTWPGQALLATLGWCLSSNACQSGPDLLVATELDVLLLLGTGAALSLASALQTSLKTANRYGATRKSWIPIGTAVALSPCLLLLANAHLNADGGVHTGLGRIFALAVVAPSGLLIALVKRRTAYKPWRPSPAKGAVTVSPPTGIVR